MAASLRAPHWLGVLVTSLLTAAPAGAAWQPSGVPLCPSCGEFREPAAAPDGMGGVYGVTWNGVHISNLRHLSATGDDAPGWTSAGAVLSTQYSFTLEPVLAADGSGGVFVAFLASNCVESCTKLDGGRVMVERLTATGARPAGWPAEGMPVVVVPPNDPHGGTVDPPVLAADAQGGLLVAWTWIDYSLLPALRQTIVVQRFDAGGTRPWTANPLGITVAPGSAGSEFTPVMAADGSGGAFVAWADRRDALPQVWLQHIGAGGTLADSAGIRLGASGLVQSRPQILADGAGGAFVAWFDSTASATYDLRAQHVDALGAPTWGSGVKVASGVTGVSATTPLLSLPWPVLAPDGAGGVFIAWRDLRAGALGTYASRLDASGHLVPPWPAGGLLTNTNPGGQLAPALAADGAGGIFVAWAGRVMTATRLGPDGTRAAGWPAAGTPLCTNGPEVCQGAYPDHLQLLADGLGGAIGVWQEYRNDPYPGGPDFERSYAQRLAGDGPVATLAALVGAEATGGRVRIEWWTSLTATLGVERAVARASSGWSRIAAVAPDPRGRVAIEDSDVRIGERYGYRLVRATGGGTETLVETWISVPALAALRLDGIRPNPSLASPVLAFALADAGPASIEVLDVAGRRVLERALAGFGPGAHEIALEESSAWPAGIYLVRLEQGGRSITTRICLVR